MQRRIVRIGWNVDQHITLFDQLVRQPEPLIAEDERRAQLGLGRQLLRHLARRQHRRRIFAQPGRDGGGEVDAVERLGHAADHPRAFEDILGATGESDRLGVLQGVVETRRHQHEVAETHGFHGPRHGPDIACAAGFDQNKSQLFEKIGVDLRQVHLK
jgi:hypothetical protein